MCKYLETKGPCARRSKINGGNCFSFIAKNVNSTYQGGEAWKTIKCSDCFVMPRTYGSV